MSSRASQWPCPQLPTTASTRWLLVKSTTACGHRTRTGPGRLNKALQRQKSKAAGSAEFFELCDEDTAGVRPGVLAEPRPQERVQQHPVDQIVDTALALPILDAPVPQTVEQLPDVLQLFPSRLSKCPRSFLRTSLCALLCAIRSRRNSWWKCR